MNQANSPQNEIAPSSSRKRSVVADLAVILTLLVLLGGAAMLIGRSHDRPAEQTVKPGARPALPERRIDPAWVRYREIAGIAVPERQVRGVAVGPNDRIYVAAGFKIYEYLPDGKPEKTYDLDNAARCLAVGPAGRLYLGAGERLAVLEPATGAVTLWKPLGKDAFLTAVAIANETLFAGDSGNRCVWRYRLDGTLLGPLGTTETKAKKHVPSTYFDAAPDRDGTFWVTDAGRHGVLHYDANGKFLGRWGKKGDAVTAFSGCCNPTQLAVTPEGKIVTVEKKPDLVKLYDPDGTFAAVVAGPKAFIPKTFIPDVAVDGKGRILVVDPKNKKVRIFVPKDG